MDVEEEGADFAAELARLKRAGSALLVRDHGAGNGICTALQGSEEEQRHRVLVRAAADDVLPVPPSGATVVEATPEDARSASRAGGHAFDPASVACRVEEADDVNVVASAVGEAIEETIGDGGRPGELRVCLGRLSPYLARDGPDAVADAVDGVMGLVRDRGGMGHAHLAVDVPDGLEDVFDVTVETRLTPAGLHEQRWHLHAAGIDTDWIEL